MKLSRLKAATGQRRLWVGCGRSRHDRLKSAKTSRSAPKHQFLRSGHSPKRLTLTALTNRALLSSSLEPPASRGNGRPNGFNDSKGPRALEKSVNRAEHARAGKAQDRARFVERHVGPDRGGAECLARSLKGCGNLGSQRATLRRSLWIGQCRGQAPSSRLRAPRKRERP